MRRGKGEGQGKENMSGKMCKVSVPKRNVICYIASQSHITCMLVKFINDHSYKVLLINRTQYHVPPGFITEQSCHHLYLVHS